MDPRSDLRPLMERDRHDLLVLLGSLSRPQWERPTAAAPWAVRDVVAHVLADDLNRLARDRDGYHGGGRPAPGEPLARFLDRYNADWVAAARRISPPLLVDLLAATSPQVLEFWRGRDLDVLGGPVPWAGPDPAPVRLDCARETTEYWVHQQQIRDATGRPGGTDPQTLHAVLDTFLRAIPLTLADQPGVALTVTTDVGTWHWERAGRGWRPAASVAGGAVLAIDADTLWRLCVRMVEPGEARRRARVDGEPALAALQIVSIIR